MVRPRSATPLSAGSNPAVTSKTKTDPCGRFFVLAMRSRFASAFRSAKRKETGSHTPPEGRKACFSGAGCGYLRKCEYPAVSQIPTRVVGFLFWRCGLALHRLSVAQSARKPVHIPHPKVDELVRQAKGVGIFAAGEYPGALHGIPFGMPFFFLWRYLRRRRTHNDVATSRK